MTKYREAIFVKNQISTFVALGLLGILFKQAERGDWLRITAISLVVSGALGNLYDRLRWDRGVVDFIGPLDLGFWYFPIFNVADIAITCGAVMLAISFCMEEKRLAERQALEEAAQGAVVAAQEGEGTTEGAAGAPAATPPAVQNAPDAGAAPADEGPSRTE